MMPFMVQRIVRLSLYVRTLDSMRPTKKKAYLDKKELKDNINRLAAEIKGGEEDVMEEYEEAVQQFAELTRSQASASETDPIAWDLFCELAGGDPGKIVYAGGRRSLNYLEMVKFNRGYWR